MKEVLRTRRCHKKECVTSAPFQPEHRNVIECAGSFLFLPPVTPLPGSVSPTHQTGSPGKGDLCAVGPRCPSADECHPLLQEGAAVPTIPPAMKRSTLGLRSQDLRPKDSKTLFADEQKCSQDRRSPHQHWPLPQPRLAALCSGCFWLSQGGGREGEGGRRREREGESERERESSYSHMHRNKTFSTGEKYFKFLPTSCVSLLFLYKAIAHGSVHSGGNQLLEATPCAPGRPGAPRAPARPAALDGQRQPRASIGAGAGALSTAHRQRLVFPRRGRS